MAAFVYAVSPLSVSMAEIQDDVKPVTQLRNGPQPFNSASVPLPEDLALLLDTIDTLQSSIDDFQCEFEGGLRFEDKGVGAMKLMEDNYLSQTSGIWIWKKDGLIYQKAFDREAPSGAIRELTSVIDVKAGEAQVIDHVIDGGVDVAQILDLTQANSIMAGGYGLLFAVEQVRQCVATGEFEFHVKDDVLNGHDVKLVTVNLKGIPELPFCRYWIDLHRSGQAIRVENYSGPSLAGRLDIQLAAFDVQGGQTWMPVAGLQLGYAAFLNKKLVFFAEPVSHRQLKVLNGSMKFNQNPGPDVFTLKFKPGTPVSDELKKIRYQFGQQQLAANPTSAELDSMLRKSVADAESQGKELVAIPREGVDWLSWLPWAFGLAVVVSTGVLILQRRAG